MSPPKLGETCPHPSADSSGEAEATLLSVAHRRGQGPSLGFIEPLPGCSKTWPAKQKLPNHLLPLGPFLASPVHRRERRKAGRARAVRACPPPHFIPFPFQRLAGSPKGSLVCLLRGEVQVPVGNPSPGWGPGLPDTRPQRLGGRWAGGERCCACVVGREVGGGWTEGTIPLTQQSLGNGGTHSTATSTTDRQTCTLRPPGALDQPVQWGTEPAAAHLPCAAPTPQAVGTGATQPRSPRPGQTTSHGECVGPTG